MRKNEIAEKLVEIAMLMELNGENYFKVRAYQNGARKLESLEEDLGTLIEEGRLRKVQGIGDSLARSIKELYRTGHLEYYERLKKSIPPGLVSMLEIPGLGVRKVRAMYEALGIDSIEELEKACVDGRLASVRGFGQQATERVLKGIKNREAYGKRHLWWDAYEVAQPILDGLRELKEVERAELAGSFRRLSETVGDLDFIASSRKPKPVMDWFCSREGVAEVTAKGETKSSVRFENGLQADLRVVEPRYYFSALHHFTGSKEHNVALRQRALGRDLNLSEWGLKPVSAESFEEADPVKSEEDLYQRLGLRWVPPELREGYDEIKLAEVSRFPRLVEEGDIRGGLHNHTHASDGNQSLEEMTRAAQEMGWEYWGVADHSKASFQANGLDEERLSEQVKAVRELNQSGQFKTHVFAGVECDILKDGSLDFEDSVLKELDYVVASVHSSFGLTIEEMTDRLIKAIEHPAVTMLGHPTGRLLLRREAYQVDLLKVIDAAIANNVIIEINANPRRMDMDWRLWRRAAEKGLLAAINPDAHDVSHFQYMRAGVNVARKGWLTKENVFNTRSLKDVSRFFKDRRDAMATA